MTPAEHLQILGPELLAEIRSRAAAAPPPSPELIAELRAVFAPAAARLRQSELAQQQAPLAA